MHESFFSLWGLGVSIPGSRLGRVGKVARIFLKLESGVKTVRAVVLMQWKRERRRRSCHRRQHPGFFKGFHLLQIDERTIQ